jgi:very-short-patch-repair endonuclease
LAVIEGLWSPEPVQGSGDREISRIASAQKGFVDRPQLLAAGLGRGAIRRRLSNGRLHEYYRGVYLVGHMELPPLGGEMAAVLLFRGRAVLSHLSAAALWGFAKPPDKVHVTLLGRQAAPRDGLVVHRVRELDRRDLRVRSGLPLTSPARALLDMASEVDEAELEQAMGEARGRRLVRDRELQDIARSAGRRPGVGVFRAILAQDGGPAFSDEGAARLLLRLLRKANLPAPETQVQMHGHRVDFLWRDARLILEVDGHRFHGHRAAFERDRKRDQRHAAAGYRVIRVTWRQLEKEPLAVIARIAQALAAA